MSVGRLSRVEAGIVVALGLLVALVFADTAMTLDDRWNTRAEAYSHGYFILLLSIGLLVRARKEFAAARLSTEPLGWLLLIAAEGMWLAGNLTETRILQQLALPLLPVGLAAVLFGRDVARIVLFPVFLLYTVIPVWDVVTPFLQHLSVVVCEALLRAVGIPVHVDRFFLELPAGILQVAEGCAGLNYLLVSLALTFVQVHLNRTNGLRVVLLIINGVVVGLVANWIRIFVLAVVAHESQMRSSLVHEHEALGWVVFAAMLIPYFLVSDLICRNGQKKGSLHDDVPVTPAASRFAIRAVAAALVCVAGPLLAHSASTWIIVPPAVELPTSINGWVSGSLTTQWRPAYLNADVELGSGYSDGHDRYDVFFYIYQRQRQGQELTYFRNELSSSAAIEINSDTQVITSAGSVRRTVLHNPDGESILIYSWYQIGRWSAVGNMAAKFYQLLSRLELRDDAMLVALAARCDHQDSDCKLQQQSLQSAAVALKEKL